MKKRLLILISLLSLALVACSASTSEQTQSTTKAEESSTAKVTEASAAATAEDAATISVLGKEFAYGESAELVVAGKTLEGAQIGETAVFYAPVSDELSGTLYAVTPMTYYDYYAAELGLASSEKYSEMSPAEELKKEGEYDTITSATSLEGSHAKDYPAILAYTAGTDLESDPLKFAGFETVDVAVDAKLYVEGLILAEVTGEKYALARAVKNLELSNDGKEPAFNNNVKTLFADGLYGVAETVETGATPVDISSVKVSSEVSYESRYGNYVFRARFSGFEKEDESAELYLDKYLDNVYSVTVEDTVGNVAGSIYYQDIWTEKGHDFLEFAISTGEIDSSGNKFTVSRFDKMFTPNTIDLPIGNYKMVIKSRGYTDMTVDVNVGTRLTEEQKSKIDDQDWSENGNVLAVDTAALPEDFEIGSYKLKAGRSTLTLDEDFSFNQDTMELTVKNTENTGVNGYKFILIDEKYQPAEARFVLKSLMKPEQLTYDGEKLVMAADSPIALADYLKKVGRLYIFEQGKEDEKPKRIWFPRANIFNDDFSFNPEATYKDKPLFETGKTYTLKFSATGFEDVELTGFEAK